MKIGLAGIGLLVLAFSANASELIVNGGFETGSLGPWVTTNSAGSAGSFYIDSATVTPLTGFPTVGAKSGNYYAVSDDFGPGSYALSQTFMAPVGLTNATLTFSIFVNDEFGGSGTGARVDLLAAGANPITGASLATLYGPTDINVVGGMPNPYINLNLDITSKLVGGTSYQLRFLAQDATGPINVGVDSVSLMATAASGVPEPAMLFPAALLTGLIASYSRKKNRR